MKFKYVIALLAICTSQLWAQTTGSLYNRLKDADLTQVIHPDSIGEDSNNKFLRPEVFGFIGDDYQRFQIHFTSFKKNKQQPYQYDVTGKTRVKGYICSFTGTVTVSTAEYVEDDPVYGNVKRGYIISDVTLFEDKSHPGSGTITGQLTTDVYFNEKGELQYDGIMIVADGYSNNQFTGKWTNYKTGESKTCNWGDFRIPDSGPLDYGAGEFSVTEEYINNGWQSYYYSYCCDPSKPETIEARKNEEAEWWK